MVLALNPNPDPNPKMEEPDHFPDQDMIPDLGIMTQDMTQDQELIDLNLLVEDNQNRHIMIDRKHNQDHSILPLLDALAASATIVIRT